MRRRAWLVVAVAGALAVAGCGDGDDDPGAAAGDEATTAEETTERSGDDAAGIEETEGVGGEEAGGDATLALSETSLGKVLVDGEGMTLYLFTPDAQGASTCTGQCAETWPPLAVEGEPVAGDGVDEGLLGTVERDDGTTQVTYDDHPLYTFAPDEAPGDVNGQGVNEVWWVVSAEGEAIEAPQEEATPTEQSPGY